MRDDIPQNEKEARWRSRIAAQAASGQTIRAYCEGEGIREHNFGYWKKRFCREVVAGFTRNKSSSRFIPLSGEARHGLSQGPRIHLPNGVEIELGESLESEAVHGVIARVCGVSRAGT